MRNPTHQPGPVFTSSRPRAARVTPCGPRRTGATVWTGAASNGGGGAKQSRPVTRDRFSQTSRRGTLVTLWLQAARSSLDQPARRAVGSEVSICRDQGHRLAPSLREENPVKRILVQRRQGSQRQRVLARDRQLVPFMNPRRSWTESARSTGTTRTKGFPALAMTKDSPRAARATRRERCVLAS